MRLPHARLGRVFVICMKRIAQVSLLLAILAARIAGAAEAGRTEEAVKREAAIAEFTAKMTGRQLSRAVRPGGPGVQCAV